MSIEALGQNHSEQEIKEMPEKAWWLYLISTRTGTLYCGITLDVERRLSEHRSNSAKSARFLRGKGPLVLQFSVIVGTHSEALKIECKVKRFSRAQKDRLIAGDLTLLAQLGVLQT